jgi:hypothetical protein
MLLKLTKNLLDIALLGLMTNVGQIHYFCGLNLNGGFSMKYGSLLPLLVGTN